MIIINNIPFEIDIEAFKKKLHLKPENGYDKCVENIVSAVRKVACPKAIYKESYIDARVGDCVIIDGVKFTGRILQINLKKTEYVFPYVVTCGTEMDSIKINSYDLIEVYIIDTIKEILLQTGMSYLERYICNRYGLQKTATMNPGSGDNFIWPIEQQKELFSLFPDINNAIGVELTESCLMIPNKSISGIRFQTDSDFNNCRLCNRKKCLSRIESFDDKMFNTTIKSI